ncbi:ABC transporter ATP-binding protein [Enterococcus sp. AZ109]|uniref:ABC transporter ATP-binding protein n=1 Tax=Enterococcus sp. AZ109 TaxID=2774634 RepID=UPI003F2852FC
MEKAITITRLEKNYGKKEVLRGIDLTVDQGEIFVLLGKNGAGKSTLFKILTGLAKETGGDFRFFGNEYDLQTDSKKIGFNINDPVFHENLSGRKNLEIHCAYMQVSDAKVDYWLNLLGLKSDDNPVKSYSTGMRQRLALARCLVHDPAILIIDEPLNGLDPRGIREFRQLIEEIAEMNKTIIMSSHILAEVEAIATRIAVISDGEIVLNQTKQQLVNERGSSFEDYLIDKMEGI